MVQRCPTELEKENVLIQSGDCSLIVAPHLGGKIASIKIKESELLQAPSEPACASHSDNALRCE